MCRENSVLNNTTATAVEEVTGGDSSSSGIGDYCVDQVFPYKVNIQVNSQLINVYSNSNIRDVVHLHEKCIVDTRVGEKGDAL